MQGDYSESLVCVLFVSVVGKMQFSLAVALLYASQHS